MHLTRTVLRSYWLQLHFNLWYKILLCYLLFDAIYYILRYFIVNANVISSLLSRVLCLMKLVFLCYSWYISLRFELQVNSYWCVYFIILTVLIVIKNLVFFVILALLKRINHLSFFAMRTLRLLIAIIILCLQLIRT